MKDDDDEDSKANRVINFDENYDFENIGKID